MESSGIKPGRLLRVLSAGLCLAVNGLVAAENSTANVPQISATHVARGSTHPTSAATKKVASSRKASYSGTRKHTTYHSGTVHSSEMEATRRTYSASASKGTTNHSSAYASRRKGVPARKRRSRPGQTRSLSGQQRLARLHLQPERVQEIQQALIREGYLQGDANGQWDSRTHSAMQHYQADHGFPATGLPEAKSLMKLGLGAHPLPTELDHSQVGAATSGAPGDLASPSASPPVSQVTPPSY